VGVGGCREEQVVAEQVGSSAALGATSDGGSENETDVTGIRHENETDMGDYVQGLDYKSFFFRCTVALCVASIDGRLLECNNEFIKICGLTKEALDASGLLSNGRKGMEFSVKSEVDVTTCDREESRRNDVGSVSGEELVSTSSKVLSLFNLLSRDDMGTVFEAMSNMLRSHSSDATKRTGTGSSLLNHWTAVVDSFSTMKRTLRINITLVRQKCGTPKYFNCAVTPCA